MKFSVQQAKQDHLTWMFKMKNFLSGLEEVNEEEIINHTETRLGKWYYNDVKEKYENVEEIKQFEIKLIKQHKLAKDILEFKKNGNIELAIDLLNDIKNNSKQITELLDEAEKKINSEKKEEIKDVNREELNIVLIDKLLDWDKSKTLLIKTDTFGKIEYVNQAFLDVSGFESIDILGKPFDIVRHPDMTLTIQKWVVKEIMQGIEANVIVKCVAKSGKYFWAVLDYKINMKSDGAIENITIKFSGLNMNIVNKHIIPLYNQLYKIEKNNGLDASKKYLRGFLEERNRTFDEFTRNLINTGKDSFNDKTSNFFKRIFGIK